MSNLKPPPRSAPWHSLLKSHLSTLLSPEFVLSTLSHCTTGPETKHPQPRARYCIFRGFWCEDLELHSSTAKSLPEGELNPRPGVYESEMLTFTTDVRMEKVGELDGSNRDGDGGRDGGGGGDVEAVFWVKELMSQWRVKGRAYVLGGEGGGEERARKAVRGWMRKREEGSECEGKDWSWEKEVTAHFANLSPVMRGSFKNPPPGTPKPTASEQEAAPPPKLGQPVYDLHDPIARENFRVVVILPEVVERVDLTSPEKSMRMRWTLAPGSSKEEEANWAEAELWP